MLYALRDPFSLLVLLVAFVVAVTLSGWVNSLMAARAGSTEVRAEQRQHLDPRRHLDPFGSVAAALTGLGWHRPVPVPFRARGGQLVLMTLAGPLVCLLVAAGCLVSVGVLEGPVLGASTDPLRYGIDGADLLTRALFLFGLSHLAVGLLALVPLPPLPGGQLLFALAPRSQGWAKAELYLVEKNLGLVAVLVLLLLPLGGSQPLLMSLLSTVSAPVVRLLTGG